jgi:hypothetical protein
MKQRKPTSFPSRREFLRDAAGAGACIAAGAALPGLVAASPPEDTPPPSGVKQGYQLTQHVLDYYKTAAI